MPLAPGPATTTARGIVKLLGDFASTSTADLPVIGSLSGASPFSITPATLQWLATATSVALAQATATSDVAPGDLSLSPQGPYASASTAINKTPGSVIANLAAPVSGGSRPSFQVREGGVTYAWMGQYQAAAGYGALYLGNHTNPILVVSTDGTYSQIGGSTLTTLGIYCASSITLNPGSGSWAAFVGGSHGGLALGYPGTQCWSDGQSVLGLNNCLSSPATNPTGGGVLYEVSGALLHRGSSGGVTTVAPSGSALTISSQAQTYDQKFGTCETVSSATATTILTYTTTSGKAGLMTIALISRATTTGTGIAVGDAVMATYALGYKNVGGTVTLSTAGLTLVGSSQTTAAALTSTLSASVSGAVITLSATNTAACTVDSQIDACMSIC